MLKEVRNVPTPSVWPLTNAFVRFHLCFWIQTNPASGWEAVEEARIGDQSWNKREGSDERSAVWWIFWTVEQTHYLHWVVMPRQTDCRLLGGQGLHFKLTLAWLVIKTLSSRRVRRREKHKFLCQLLLIEGYVLNVLFCQIQFCAEVSFS